MVVRINAADVTWDSIVRHLQLTPDETSALHERQRTDADYYWGCLASEGELVQLVNCLRDCVARRLVGRGEGLSTFMSLLPAAVRASARRALAQAP